MWRIMNSLGPGYFWKSTNAAMRGMVPMMVLAKVSKVADMLGVEL